MVSRNSIRTILVTAMLALPGPVAATGGSADELLFRVMLDDKDIGVHRFSVEPHDDGERVDIQADFDVTFFAIPVYSYDHRNREVWRDGCLARIESTTDDNGDEFRVDGEDLGDRFVVATQSGKVEFDAECVMSFAYWNRDFLTQGRLLNAQTGEYLPISLDDLGTRQLRLGESSVTAQGYRLSNRAEEIDIDVWYETGTGRWLSLESRVGGERTLRYLPLAGAAAERARQRLASDSKLASTMRERRR